MNVFIRNHRQIQKYGYSVQLSGKYSRCCVRRSKSSVALSICPDGGGGCSSSYLDDRSWWRPAGQPSYRVGAMHAVYPTLYRTRQIAAASYGYNHHQNINNIRHFHVSHYLRECPSSKVEETVNNMKEKQKEKVEEIMKEAANGVSAAALGKKSMTESSGKSKDQIGTQTQVPETPKPVVMKKSLKTRIWEELVHYYHGFRLLFIDINICRKLVWRVLNGKKLSRRENRLLVRTSADMFRLIPFSVFIIVPFMEFLLPFFIKFFPGMLPSTFQTAKEREDKLKQSLQVKLEMAKFLQKTLDEMSVQHKEHRSEDAKQFAEFFKKIKDPSEHVSSEDIIKFSKRFEDEITLDSLSREQLIGLCRVLELGTIGTTNFLRYHLRVKLRSLAADDRVIAREGVDALDLFELQQACKARGMRAYGLTAERLRAQLQEWIDLSLNEKVPPILLLLSRALAVSDETTTTEKLKETIRVLPDVLGAQTKVAIGEREGKIDNKSKIEAIKEEERMCKEERDEEREEKKKAEVLLDKAPVIDVSATAVNTSFREQTTGVATGAGAHMANVAAGDACQNEKAITSKDVELLSEALQTLSKDKNKLLVEKEAIKDLKEELADYKEDVEELAEVRDVVNEPVCESAAAKMLFNKVNNMIDKLDKVLVSLEERHHQLQEATKDVESTKKEDAQLKELVTIDELVATIKKLKQTSDESRLKQIEKVLAKIDADKDGVITVDEVLNVIEAIGRENVNLNEQQIEELITLLGKEQVIQAEEKIEKALAKSAKEEAKKKVKEAQKEACMTIIGGKKSSNSATKTDAPKAQVSNNAHKPNDAIRRPFDDELNDSATEVKDKTTDMNLTDRKHNIRAETGLGSEATILTAVEKQKEKIISKSDISTAMPPTIPPPTSKPTQVKPKDKVI